MICGQNILRTHDFDKIWSIEEWKQLTSSWMSCLQILIEDNLSPENVSLIQWFTDS